MYVFLKSFLKKLIKPLSNNRGELDLGGGDAGSESMIVDSGSTPPVDGGGEPSADPALGNDVPPQEPAFNSSEWALNYKGKPIQIRDRNHLTALAQKGYGYDQDMNSFKQRQAELDEQGIKYQQYGQLEEALSQNPALKQKIFAMLQNPDVGADTEGFDEEPSYVSEMRQELQEIKEWRDSQNNRYADQELDSEISQLKKDFPQHEWDNDNGDGNGTLTQQILKHAHNEGKMFPSLHAAYKDFFWDNRDATVAADTLKANAELLARQKAAGKVGGDGQPAPAPSKPGYTPGKSYSELAEIALKR